MHIEVREKAQQAGGGFAVAVIFDHGPERHTSVRDPFDEAQEQELAWYYETWLSYPFMEGERAAQAARSAAAYGQALFRQVFRENADIYADYKAGLAGGLEGLIIEIAGTPAFHALHWEALQDPALPRPLAVEATFLRKNLTAANVDARPRPSPTLNILLVTSRPGGRRDVNYRTISRPLVAALANSAIRARIDLVRPGSYEALVRHLEKSRDRHGSGHYHIIHFDLHGSLLRHDHYQATCQRLLDLDLAGGLAFEPGYGRTAIAEFAGQKAFLFFDGPAEGAAEPVADEVIAGLMQAHQIPIAILNACQSAKQLKATGAGAEAAAEAEAAAVAVAVAETSLGSRLMAAGAQLVVAMGYSVTVTAAEKLMSELYRQLLAGQPPAQAIRQGRLALYNDRKRQAAYDQQIELEDWLLPVVYQNRPVALPITPFASAEAESAYLERQAARYQPPEPTYGFVGRDLDILTIERRLLAAAASNILLVRGLGGAGKSSLLRHLMGWWQRTGLVEQVAYFGYDERAWHLEQILDGLGRKLYGEDGYDRELGPLSATARQQKLVDRLRAERHLLVLDNLESVTGAALAIRHTLDEAARGRLAAFVRALQGGRSLLLLGSRGGEGWLLAGLAGGEGLVYELPGLDPQAAADLAERILQRAGAAGVRSDPAQGDDFRDLMRLLDGHPLAMEVVLPNLKQQSPAGVLAALREGAAGVDPAEVIFRCVEYSHGNLDPEAQALLAGLAPFVGVVNTSWLPLYTEQLQQEAALAGLPFSRWAEVVQALLDWGLASQHEVGGGYLRLQPVLPYFLRRKLAGDSVSEAAAGPRQAAIERAFRRHYDGLGGALGQLIESKEPGERQLGQALIGLEYENLHQALRLALSGREGFYNLLFPLDLFLDQRQEHGRRIPLLQSVLAAREGYPPPLAGDIGVDFIAAGDWLGSSLLQTQQYPAAAQVYQDKLTLLDALTGVADEWRGKDRAGTYHQLGRVAEEQRQWAAAEGYYRQALALYVEFNDRYEQAGTYHQLGRVAQAQRQWAAAEGYLLQSLEIFQQYQDEYSLGITRRSLGRVWRAGGDGGLLARAAALLGVPEAEVAAQWGQA